jgi:predicted CopG family antitoxin
MADEKEENTTITLPKTLVEKLHRLKAYGESYADVIERLLNGKKITKP